MLFDVSFLPWILPFIIFVLRVIGIGLDTMRVLFMIRGRRWLVWLLGFTETALWVLVISSLLSNLGNIWNMLAYAGGFATGNVVGMVIESRMALGYVELRIVSTSHGNEIADGIRAHGHAATIYSGRGRDGKVDIVLSGVMRRDLKAVQQVIRYVDPKVFITVGEIQPVHRGFWRIG